MSSKNFKKTYKSSLIINKPNTGSNDIVTDWQRAASNHKEVIVSIDDKLLSSYSKDYFSNVEHLKNFFETVILSKLVQKDKKEIAAYLMTAFHQGGLLNPVSSALVTEAMYELDPQTGEKSYYGIPRETTLKHQIDIATTERGFTVHECCTLGTLVIVSGTSLSYLVTDNNPELQPEPGKDYVIKAEGTIDVDFSKSAAEPRIEIANNTIEFGHSKLAEKMNLHDESPNASNKPRARSLLQIIIDFFKNILGLNNVAKASEVPDSSAQEDSRPGGPGV